MNTQHKVCICGHGAMVHTGRCHVCECARFELPKKVVKPRAAPANCRRWPNCACILRGNEKRDCATR